jgi:hypothetical protein
VFIFSPPRIKLSASVSHAIGAWMLAGSSSNPWSSQKMNICAYFLITSEIDDEIMPNCGDFVLRMLARGSLRREYHLQVPKHALNQKRRSASCPSRQALRRRE